MTSTLHIAFLVPQALFFFHFDSLKDMFLPGVFPDSPMRCLQCGDLLIVMIKRKKIFILFFTFFGIRCK